MYKKFSKWTIVIYAAIFVLGVLLGPAVSAQLAGLKSGDSPAAAAQAGDPQAIPPELAGPDAPNFSTFVCTPDFVGEFIDRVHVHCTVAASGTIWWFATPTSDSKRAARIYSTLLTALASAKNVRVYYDPAASGAAYGCSFSNCRPILYLELIK
jgi:heme A synthase